jgi:hypothetical protein
MHRGGFEHRIIVFERVKIFYGLDCAATVIGDLPIVLLHEAQMYTVGQYGQFI